MRNLLARNQQFLLYCVIGASGASLDFLLYSVLLKGFGMHHQLANAVGYGSGTVFSFVLNAWLNFKTRDRLLKRFLSFSGVGLLGWMTSAGMLYLLVDWLSIEKISAKLLTIGLIVFLQYNLNRCLSFRRMPSQEQ